MNANIEALALNLAAKTLAYYKAEADQSMSARERGYARDDMYYAQELMAAACREAASK